MSKLNFLIHIRKTFSPFFSYMSVGFVLKACLCSPREKTTPTCPQKAFLKISGNFELFWRNFGFELWKRKIHFPEHRFRQSNNIGKLATHYQSAFLSGDKKTLRQIYLGNNVQHLI